MKTSAPDQRVVDVPVIRSALVRSAIQLQVLVDAGPLPVHDPVDVAGHDVGRASAAATAG